MTGAGDEDTARRAAVAPWETRVWATWVDLFAFVLVLLPFVAYAQLTAVPREYGDATDLTPAGIVAAWVGVLLYLALWSWNRYVRQARTGQTIGKRRQRLRVVDLHGRTPTTARLLVRDLAHVLDVLPAFLGLLWPIWDRRGQTFADKLTGTVVVAAVPAGESPAEGGGPDPAEQAPDAQRATASAPDAAERVAPDDPPDEGPVPAGAETRTAGVPGPSGRPGSPVGAAPSSAKVAERRALIAFFRSVDRDDVVALPPSRERFDQSDGHDEAEEIARQRGIGSPSWLFWHRQAAGVFDEAGDLTGPLRINWGGSHERVAGVLATLPAPFRVVSNGSGGVFEIHSDELAVRQAQPLPDISDTKAVKARIKAITMQRRKESEWSDAEVAWMNDVLARGEVAAQGYVVRHLAGSERLTDEAFEALMGRWRRIYAAAPRDVLVLGLLRTLHRRGDQRLEEVVEECLSRSRYTFAYGVAQFLVERGDAADLPRLYRLALTPGRYTHTPGNFIALEGWVKVRSAHTARPVVEIAEEALADPAFDEAARRRLAELVEKWPRNGR